MIWLAVLAAAAGGPARAGQGTSAAASLDIRAGARAEGLGGAYTAASRGAEAVFWNPAGLPLLDHPSLSFTHIAYLDFGALNEASYAHPVGKGALGLGFRAFSMGALDRFDQNGQPLGAFSPGDTVVSLGYARTAGGYSLGLTGKWVESRVITAERAFTADAGVMTPPWWGGRFRAGLSATNITGGLGPDPLPGATRLGGCFKAGERWLATVEAVGPRNSGIYGSAGLERTLVKTPQCGLSARVGYQGLGDGGGGSFSTGLGFSWRTWSVDYAFIPLEELAAEHRLSLGYVFGRRTEGPPPAPKPAVSSALDPARSELESRRRALDQEWEQLEIERQRLALEWKKLEEAQARKDFPAPARERREIVAVVTSVEKGLQIRTERPDAPWEDARPGRFLFLGDTLRTPTGARAVVTFVNGVESKIAENTSFKLGLQDGDEKVKQAIDLWIGEVFSKVEKGKHFIIKTPQGRAKVKGTAFGVKVRKKATAVEVDDGVVEVSNGRGSVDVGPGERSVMDPSGSAPTPPEPSAPSPGPAWHEGAPAEEERAKSRVLTDFIRETTPDRLLKDIGRTEGLEVDQAAGSARGPDRRPVSDGEEIRITVFDKAVHFAVGRAEIPTDAAPALDKIASLLGFFPSSVVEIGGHTDSRGEEGFNLALSEKRAGNVRDYLFRRAPGLTPERLLSGGFGESKPVASNGTAKGRALNRRVEILLKRKSP